MIRTIAGRELRSAFATPFAWTLLASLQFVAAYVFLDRLERLRLVLPRLLAVDGAPGVTDLVIVPVLGIIGGLLLLVVPVLAMGAIAGERRRGSLALLRSSPVSPAAIVVGKWLASFALIGIALAVTAVMCASLAFGTSLDWGKFAAASFGTLLLTAAFVAAGVWVSSLTRHPATAAVGTLGLLLGLWFAGAVAPAVTPLTRFQTLLQGVVSSGDVAYFVLATAWFLGLAVHRVDAETAPSGWRTRAQGWVFVILFTAAIGVAGFLADRHAVAADWTHGDRNSLSSASAELVAELETPLTVAAFVRDDEFARRQVESLVTRYRDAGADVELEFVNPDLEPERTREAGIMHEMQLSVGYGGRTERVSRIDERSFSSAVQRLVRGGGKFVAFLTGHGERDPYGDSDHDLGTFGDQLVRQGLRPVKLNPAMSGVPDDLDGLVITQPRATLVPGVAELLVHYVENGGDLLWLADPAADPGLAPVADALGVEIGDAPVEDQTSRMFGIDDARIVVVADYGDHPITNALTVVTLLPHAAAVQQVGSDGDWSVTPLLTTMGGKPLGMALERGAQRVAVIGDGDFLSNANLNHGANLQLGLNLVNWVVGDDAQLDVALRSAPDLTFELHQNAYYAIAFISLLGLPLGYVVAAFTIRWRRRRR